MERPKITIFISSCNLTHWSIVSIIHPAIWPIRQKESSLLHLHSKSLNNIIQHEWDKERKQKNKESHLLQKRWKGSWGSWGQVWSEPKKLDWLIPHKLSKKLISYKVTWMIFRHSRDYGEAFTGLIVLLSWLLLFLHS